MTKYATLPDIDTSGADVFETPDVPQEHSRSRDSDSDDDLALLARSNSPTALRRTAPATSHQPQVNTDIDADRLDATEARRRFGDATRARLDRQQLRDDAAARRPSRRVLPPAREYVAHAPSSLTGDETPLERLRRLRREVAELEEDVERERDEAGAGAESGSGARGAGAGAGASEGAEGSSAAGDGAVAGAGATEAKDGPSPPSQAKKDSRAVSPAVLLQQLHLLRGDLAGVAGALEGPRATATAEGAQGAAGGLAARASESAGLLARLGAPAPAASGAGPAGEQQGAAPAGAAGDKAKASGRGDMGEGALERRVAELELALGASGADVSESSPHPAPLLPTLSRLEHLVTLLTQPRHLDSISRRVKVLVQDLERIHDSRRKLGDSRPLNVALQGGMTLATGGGTGAPSSSSTAAASGGSAAPAANAGAPQLPPDAAQQLSSLAALLPRIDPLLPLAPRLLSRLRSLSALHARAAAFGDELGATRDEVRRLAEADQGLGEVLRGLEGSVEGNEERTRANLESVERRVEDVVRRLDALSAPGKAAA
ncbi:uncharacterized protein RHOBADRAFT_53637 [Rhodotorula graminis WP1]|uniref:Uncharacterized protein n=1 Tax=Rhodotorula graminis (strain WP1) TaxID=578459 RepID=A0A194S2D4_RHOGW|nr:uncharacterized protein RHOBADRAFT_53637 [Rhodotorula graminis WP1]KPV74680.1 hypothetical protein RHOBADRAFT_53637 [Rhodotorula graminis WP1]